jgi:hypothetical protein
MKFRPAIHPGDRAIVRSNDGYNGFKGTLIGMGLGCGVITYHLYLDHEFARTGVYSLWCFREDLRRLVPKRKART